ncbi:MAG: sigma-70 family RNA polymerase sigma factor [Verrucomicrobiales bacterium]|nr:sigma-70 family RNA polymerase sigma factor [Verrucomicrobiales bacterium]
MKRELSITTRSSLLERLKNLDDHESWQQFARTYSDLIRRLALKAQLTEEEAEDALQEVLVSVARNIGRFKYDPTVSSFKHWLTNTTRWRIVDQRRKRLFRGLLYAPPPEGKKRTDALERIPDPSFSELEANEAAEWSRSVVDGALARVKRRLKENKDYQIYYLLVLKEKPMAEVCRQLRVNPGHVYLAKHRVAKLVKDELQSLRHHELR